MNQSSFEVFLDRLDPTWRAGQLAFFRTVAEAGPEAVAELKDRVQRVSCSPGLRQLTLEFSFYHPWPEWLPVLDRVLRQEKDLVLFKTGVRALGRMGIPAATASLRALSQSRAEPDFREAADQVLQETDPAGAFQHHLARLLQGSAQPADANEGARQLAKLLSPDGLEPLQAAVRHPDPLVARHALRLVGQIPTAEAAAFLLDFLKDTHQEALEDREIRALLTAFRALPRPEVQEQVLQALIHRWEARQPEVAADFASGQSERIQAAMATLRESAPSLLDTFLLDTLLAASDEKAVLLTRQLGQAGDLAQHRGRGLEFALDTAAQGLADLASRGLLDAESLLAAMAECLRQNTGKAGVAAALTRLVPPSAQDLLDLLLDQAEGSHRSAVVEGLGERRDPAFRTALLKALRDPIADITQRALWHLGQLPEPEGMARAHLAEAGPEEAEVWLRFIAMHRLAALVPDLLALVASDPRESLLLAALETLGAVGSPEAVDPLLNLLHSGQPPRIQTALAEALRDLGNPDGALALCAKAAELKAPELQTVAVEALARAHDTVDRPLSRRALGALATTVRGGWNSRNPWPLRRRIADALVALQLEAPSSWADLSGLIQKTLSERRQPGEVAPEDLAHIQSCARVLAQRAQA
ncbi:MAG TPA: HEAT repeat domain-containing protein [Geothrix sp.]|jgi:HEAT repeat protein